MPGVSSFIHQAFRTHAWMGGRGSSRGGETSHFTSHAFISCSSAHPSVPAVPYPLLGENTLVLSDVCVIALNQEGVPCLMCRAADT